MTATLSVRDILQSGSAAFGTSGLRGLVDDLDFNVVSAVVGGFIERLTLEHPREKQVVLLGHDLRPSSPNISTMVAEALERLGIEMIYAGAVPTPALALAGRFRGLACIMVTGSHIPFDRNGIKFYTPAGEISKKDETFILDAEVLPSDAPNGVVLPAPDPAIAADYTSRFTEPFANLLNGKRIGVYQHSAVGRDLNVNLFEQLGAEVIALGRSEAFVPVDTEAVSAEDVSQCQAWVGKYNLDAVFSTDGDGDRPLLGDDQGNYFRGDVLGILAARFLGVGAIATPVSSNTAVEKSDWFEHVLRTKIGSPHVLAAMEQLQVKNPNISVAGFEANGGFLTQTDVRVSASSLSALPTRDALLPALAVMGLAKQNDMRLSEVASLLPPRFTVSGRLQNRPSAASLAFLSELSSDQAKRNDLFQELGAVVHTDMTDGLRMTTDGDEIVHLRPSGNAPEFRIYVEAQSEPRATEILSSMIERLGQLLPEA